LSQPKIHTPRLVRAAYSSTFISFTYWLIDLHGRNFLDAKHQQLYSKKAADALHNGF
jgi:hypothetical protein